MMPNDSRGAVRDGAVRLVEILDEVGDDICSAEKEITAVMADLLAIPGLDEITASPSGASSPSDRTSTGWIYYDCDLRIVRGRMPAGFVQSPHNHGSWNIFGIYRGAAHYRSYRRLDDRSQRYVADLEVAEDRVMTDGDITLLPAPPDDIHTVAALAPVTTSLLVARSQFSAIREQYLPDRHTYYEVGAEQAAAVTN
jgi:predicted metal-dependent enzyme (double-stranded beta helix superfamily)